MSAPKRPKSAFVLACSTIETASQIILGIKWQDRFRDFLYPTKEQLKLGKASSRWLMCLVFVTRLRYAVGNNVSGVLVRPICQLLK